MGAISPSVFVTRDVVEYVLPAAIATCLFAPFVRGEPLGLESLVAGAVLASYVLGSVRDTLSEIPWVDGTLARLHLRPPADRPENRERTIREIREEKEWQSANWDYDRFFYSLSKDDREYLYLTSAYGHMSYALSLYLLFYGIVNLLWLAGHMAIAGLILGLSWADVVVDAPVLGGRQVPALLLILLSYLAANSLYSWYIKESESLFADWGEYNQFVRRGQRETGGLATAVWGRVRSGGQAVAGAWVELTVDGTVQGRERSDEQGRFRFSGAHRSCIGRDCCLRVSSGIRRREVPIHVEPKEVPEFDVDLVPAPPPELPGALSVVLALLRRFTR